VLSLIAGVEAANPGFGWSEESAYLLYGIYTWAVYVTPILGGLLADRYLGTHRSLLLGGWIIAAGHFTMAVPGTPTFFLGLVFIICGTGLLKPNVSTIVGELYPEGGARRDAGFSVFYMGINLGAFFGPIVTGFLGEGYQWHWGFGAAGVGMVLGLIQYRLGQPYLGDIGHLRTDKSPEEVAALSRKFFGGFFAVVALVCLALPWPHWTLALPAAMIGGALFGAAWAAVPAYLQAKRGSHIVITTIMFNYIASALIIYMLVSVLKPVGQMDPATANFPPGTALPTLNEIPGLNLIFTKKVPANISLFVALIACWVVWLMLWRTRLGYEIRAFGRSEPAR